MIFFLVFQITVFFVFELDFSLLNCVGKKFEWSGKSVISLRNFRVGFSSRRTPFCSRQLLSRSRPPGLPRTPRSSSVREAAPRRTAAPPPSPPHLDRESFSAHWSLLHFSRVKREPKALLVLAYWKASGVGSPCESKWLCVVGAVMLCRHSADSFRGEETGHWSRVPYGYRMGTACRVTTR